MISELHWKNLEEANRQLALRFEKMRKARTTGDKHGIKMTEMDYFQALQFLYAAVEEAVSDMSTSN